MEGSRTGGGEPALRILLVINTLGPGGAEHSTLQMIPALAERGIEVEIAALQTWPDPSEQAAIPPDHRVEGRNLALKLVDLRRLIRRSRPDIVHSMIFEADVLGRLSSAFTGIPVMSSLINMSYEPIRLSDPNVRRSRLALTRWIDAITARTLTFWFHAITEAVAAHAESTLGIDRRRVTVVPRGRDPKRFAPRSRDQRLAVRRALGVDETTRLILSVGRQEFQKGHVDAVSAMDGILGREPDAVLMIAGREGNATPDIVAAVERLEDPRRVRLLGNRADVADLMAAADVFVFPSLYEGLGGTMIEAMAMGLPIVCSDLPPLREVTGGEAALLVPPGNPPMLSKALLSLLDDANLARRLGAGGRRRFEEHFTLDRVVDQMASLYRDVHRRKTLETGT